MNNTTMSYLEIIEKYKDIKIGVIGDFIADVYIYGSPRRLSREAPIVVIEYEYEELRPGGAANSVNNIAALEALVFPVSLVGDDKEGGFLKETLCKGKVSPDGIFVEPGFETLLKSRILAGDLHTVKQQIARIDKGKPYLIDTSLEIKILDYINKIGQDTSAWVVSDYGYQFLTDKIRERIRDLFPRNIVVADTRHAVKEFGRITAITPNESEALNFGRYFLNDKDNLFVIGEQLIDILHLNAALITRGNKGMLLFEKDKEPVEISVVGTKEIVDVSGAGDTVTSTFTLSLACGATFEQAARLANCAASVVVMKSGTATCSKDELIRTVEKYL
ncbi:MAG: bifunctional ADP-heptose synthase [Planctomycetota bacterium]